MALGFVLICAVPSPVHIEICAGGGSCVDEPTDKQDGKLFLSDSLSAPKIENENNYST